MACDNNILRFEFCDVPVYKPSENPVKWVLTFSNKALLKSLRATVAVFDRQVNCGSQTSVMYLKARSVHTFTS